VYDALLRQGDVSQYRERMIRLEGEEVAEELEVEEQGLEIAFRCRQCMGGIRTERGEVEKMVECQNCSLIYVIP
jgi:hypothetical protein